MSTPTSNTVSTAPVARSGDPFIDPLIHSLRWAANPTALLTYSFAGTESVWNSPYSQLDEPSGIQPFGATETAAARATLQLWARYANITFTETSDTSTNVGDIRFAYTTVDEEESAAHTYLPNNNPRSGDIWLDTADISGRFQPGESGHFLLIHEIGHTLGLKHPFETDGLNGSILNPAFDNISFTVMSYNLYPDMQIDKFAISILPTTPMPLDIEAIQYLYGARPFNTGDNQYVYTENQDYFETIYDTGGTDTIVWNSNEQFAIIDLAGGSWSSLGNALLTYNQQGQIVEEDLYNVAIFRTSVIENVISGGSDDDIYGNEVANRLEAGAGHDIVWGDAGADTILGGAGNDHLYGQSPTGGSDGVDNIFGGDGGDYLQGNAGNDMLDGGDGSDRINGGANDDNILGAGGNDTINGNLGADTVSGAEGNDSLRGGQGGDSISGGAGNDILSGDLGADTLSGGGGVDLFIFSGGASSTSQPDRVTDFQSGVDRFALGFSPSAILTGSAQSGAGAATTAQQLLDGRAGNGEVAVVTVGFDTHLFYATGGGVTVDSAIILSGLATLTTSDFG